MRIRPLLSMLILAVLAGGGGCHRMKVAQAPPSTPPKQNIVVLLPHEGAPAGALVVSNSGGTQDLTQTYTAIRMENATTAPSAPFYMDQATVKQLFADVLNRLPLPEQHFTLYMDLGTETLTPESDPVVTEILKSIQERHSTDITVTGHTDTTGDVQSNYQLGLHRAQRIADILLARGVDAANLSVTSHGEADPLVQTARGVNEPRNRRVEVVVR
jgi:outer membrane protein OmpA-like peptidoglycan-associated protein